MGLQTRAWPGSLAQLKKTDELNGKRADARYSPTKTEIDAGTRQKIERTSAAVAAL
jgi:hypothetical protein